MLTKASLYPAYASWLPVLFSLFSTLVVQAETSTADWEKPGEFTLQMGMDGWDLRTPNKSNVPLKGVDRLFLANSEPKWNYQNTSPWMKVNGKWDINDDLALIYKVRSEQSVGTKVDDMHLDFRMSPYLGFRTGVLDYKTSWCRTYDIDSPWVRENDPFCTSPITNAPTLAAPGLQSYVMFNPSHYQIQALAGVYRPKVFGYGIAEFSDVAHTAPVAINNRWGWSLNALDLNNAAELRLSWLGARQETERDKYGYRGQKGGVWYLGASFSPVDDLNVRVYTLRSSVDQISYNDPPLYTPLLDLNMVRQSKAIEFTYQIDGQNMLAYAMSRFTQDWDMLGLTKAYEAYTIPNYVHISQTSTSVSWRHELDRGIYMAFQWTHASNNQHIYNIINTPAAKGGFITTKSIKQSDTKGDALGIRLGFAY